MTILFFLGAGTTLGPGTSVQIQLATSPVPQDDYVIISAIPPVVYNLPPDIGGNVICHGNLFPIITLGVQERLAPLPFFRPVMTIAAGTQFRLQANQYHANGSGVDTGTSAQYSWDPIGNPSGLFAGLFFGSSALQEILDAVKHVYPAT